ncbi:peptide/nitrate transporter [Acrasis kona]|uniref:Peptide/nitrate transporter n=1 Tax=Acrasis kona TaxID=1008807 RepID=A0AAW2ZEB4_9EUKA
MLNKEPILEDDVDAVQVATNDNDDVELLQDDQKDAEADLDDRLPWKTLSIALLLWTCDLFSFTTLSPYLPFMVEDFKITQDKSQIGYYVGFIGSLYYLGQFFSCFFWGWASDRYGRRPVLLAGMLGSIITSAAFGFSVNLYMAIATRTLFGLLNGNLGVFKTYIGEVSNKRNQSKAFSVLGVAGGFGNILGPIIGGFLSRPVYYYPSMFDKFDEWNMTFLRSFFTKFPYVLPNIFVSITATLGFILGLFFLKESNPAVLRRGLNRDVEQASTHQEPKKSLWERIRTSPILQSRIPLTTSVIYAFYGFSSIVWYEVIPLWLVLPVEYGGLASEERTLGILSGVTDKLGAIGGIRYSGLLIAPSYILYPQIVKLEAVSNIFVWVGLIFVMCLRHAIMNLQVTAISMITNNSVKPDQKGRLNGISQSMVAFTRTFGPAAGGSIFAWSVHNKVFPFDVHFTFVIICVSTLIMCSFTIGLPKSINHPLPDEQEIELDAIIKGQNTMMSEIIVDTEMEQQKDKNS